MSPLLEGDFSAKENHWMLDQMHPYSDTVQGRQRLSQNRVLRGGSWINKPQNLRAANRNNNTPDNRNQNNGLRLAGALTIVADAIGGSLNQLPDRFHLGGQTQDPRHVSRQYRRNPLAQSLPVGRLFRVRWRAN